MEKSFRYGARLFLLDFSKHSINERTTFKMEILRLSIAFFERHLIDLLEIESYVDYFPIRYLRCFENIVLAAFL